MSVHESQTSGAETGERQPIQLDQLKLLAHLDRDAFGKIMLAESGDPPRVCAVKVIEKKRLVESDETGSAYTAKRVSMVVNGARHPFLTHLYACFQTESCVYFVTEYNAGGTLMRQLQRGAFERQRAQLYAAEICLAVKYLHENGIIHRNLQLDNILLASDGHIKVSDYGLCKEDIWHGSTTSTFCGTASFMAPEILLDKKYSRPIDWWSFGVILYQMLLRKEPFTGEGEDEIYDAILGQDLQHPADMPENDSSILQKLLLRDPEQRLGSGPTDAQEIMTHPFFQDIVWDDVYYKKVQPPFVPTLQSETDTSNFDEEFTKLPPVLDDSRSPLAQASQDTFKDFDYVADFVLE